MPTISIDGLTPSSAAELHRRLEEVAKSHSNQPMLLELISVAAEWVQSDQPASHPQPFNSGHPLAQDEPPTPVTPHSSEKRGNMRTAGDVIARIRWDAKLNGEDFEVTYLDRFKGEMKILFKEVDWDAPPFPQHRIQSFKFRGETVWDKRIPLDRVFGSRGDGSHIEDVLQNTSHGDGPLSDRANLESSEDI